MESVDNKEEMRNSDSKFNQEIHSKVVRAGKRTYFFDVKSTRNEEFYLTITESKKRFEDNGNFHYEKHKIFLYKEDFEKFSEVLHEIINYINENQTESIVEDKQLNPVAESEPVVNYSNVDFEDI
jgi:effector-binding domain-containing protein